MGPNKRKSYLRKLAKEGYSYKRIIHLLDLFNVSMSFIQTGKALPEICDEKSFEELKEFSILCSKLGLGYDDIQKLDKRPYLEGYLSARLKHNEYSSLTRSEVFEEASKEESYDFQSMENVLIDIPEYGYGTYISVYENQTAKELGFPSDYEYTTLSNMLVDLKTLQNQFGFNYVIVHLNTDNGITVLLHDYTQLNEKGNCTAFQLSPENTNQKE